MGLSEKYKMCHSEFISESQRSAFEFILESETRSDGQNKEALDGLFFLCPYSIDIEKMR